MKQFIYKNVADQGKVLAKCKPHVFVEHWKPFREAQNNCPTVPQAADQRSSLLSSPSVSKASSKVAFYSSWVPLLVPVALQFVNVSHRTCKRPRSTHETCALSGIQMRASCKTGQNFKRIKLRRQRSVELNRRALRMSHQRAVLLHRKPFILFSKVDRITPKL